MNPLPGQAALGLALPGPAYLIGALVFGILGYIAVRRGRKTAKPALTCLAGVALLVYPYGISQTWLLDHQVNSA